MKRLFIAEKPSVAKALSEALGIVSKHGVYTVCSNGDDVVTFCVGHIMEQAEPDEYTPDDVPKNEKTGKKIWREEDLPIIPSVWKLKAKSDLKDQVKNIQSLLKQKPQIVVNAGDPDAEGQLLVDELLEHFNFKGTVLRYWCAAQDQVSVKRGLSNMQPNSRFIPLGRAALARSRADWLIGMNLSRAYTLAAQRSGTRALLTAGRVQSAVLSLAYDRWAKIKNFVPVSHYKVMAEIQHSNGFFKATWKPDADETGFDENGRLINAKVAETLVASLTGKNGYISECEIKAGTKGQPEVWTQAKLQIAVNARYGVSVSEVLEACQRLYEVHRLTSYPRVDCGLLPESQFADAPDILSALRAMNPDLAAIIDRADTSIKSKTWNDKKMAEMKAPHHGIIPTQERGDLSKLNDVERIVYDMIVRRYLAQFYPPQKFERTVIQVAVDGQLFQANGRVIIDKGWTAVNADTEEPETNEGSIDKQALPKVAKDDKIVCVKGEMASLKTEALPQFTQGTLIEAMLNVHKYVDDPIQKKALKEGDGIGTEATRANLIKELINRGYFEEKGKALVISELGRSLVSVIHPSVKSPAMTAVFERIMKMIEAEELSVDDFLARQVALVTKEVIRLRTATITISGTSQNSVKLSEYKCPLCGSALIRRAGKKKGTFWWGCSGYPKCVAAFSDSKGSPDFTRPFGKK